MSKHTPNHKNFLEIRPLINGRTVDKITVPFKAIRPINWNTFVTGEDRLFVVSKEDAEVLEKYV